MKEENVFLSMIDEDEDYVDKNLICPLSLPQRELLFFGPNTSTIGTPVKTYLISLTNHLKSCQIMEPFGTRAPTVLEPKVCQKCLNSKSPYF